MAGVIQRKPYVNFIGGLWTESSPLNYPENTSQIEQNFRINPDGTRERRLGLEEINHTGMSKQLLSNWVVHSYRWLDANNANDSVYIAVQKGRFIHLYEESKTCRSDYTLAFSVDLQNFAVNNYQIWDYPVSFASGMGKLFIAHKSIQPIYITYNQGGLCKNVDEGWKVTTVQLYERDFDGVEDGLADDEHPTVLTQEHLYNLLNQGWTMEYVQKYFDEVGEYPSNNEIWFLGFYTDPNDGKEKWSVEELRKSTIGAARAPRGHFIRNVFDTCDYFEKLTDLRIIAANAVYEEATDNWNGRIRIVFSKKKQYNNGDTIQIVGSSFTHTNSTGTYVHSYDGTYTIGTNAVVSGDGMFAELEITVPNFEAGVSALLVTAYGNIVTTDSEDVDLPVIPCCVDQYRPEVVAFYAGRVWYSGIDSRRIGNKVYFSQVLTDDSKIGKMYQEYDPTSKEFSEMLKTDGGVIDIPELGWVKSLEPLKDALLLFVDNGIWGISGGEYGYFAATSYSVSKLTDVGCIAKKSVKPIEDTFVFASDRGVYVVSSDHRITNITEEAIHHRYRKIPAPLKPFIDIAYNPYDKTIHIFHNLEIKINPASGLINKRWRYCSELILNHRIKAWYEYKHDEALVANAHQTGDSSNVPNHLLYWVGINDKSRPHYMSNCDFIDYKDTSHEVDASAYFLSSPDSLGELMQDKKINELDFFIDSEPQTDGKFEGRWDFSCDACSGDFTAVQSVFKAPKICNDRYPYRVVRTDLKVKGKGRAFEISIMSVPLKPLKIYGWAIEYESVPDRA